MTTIRDDRREAAIERMADHLLKEGLAGASLRPLAAAAGTSDRMLLYYFADKDEILAVTLERIAGRFAALLDGALPADHRMPPAVLMRIVWAASQDPGVKPFMRLWLDLVAGAAGDRPAHKAVARTIATFFRDWLVARLDLPEAERPAEAARWLGLFEGLVVLEAAGCGDLVEAAIARESDRGL
jgi:AcrR family transcriptional regulator